MYENDVHCGIDGYAKMAGLRDAIRDTADVAVVSCGDFIQGDIVGALSHGQYIIDIMKIVGYDAVTLGNHEFDYYVPRLQKLLTDLKAPVTCVNFTDADRNRIYLPYVIKTLGGKTVAFIGAVTPVTMISEEFAFYDKTGKLIAIKNVTENNDLMIIEKSGLTIRMAVTDIRVAGRATQGVKLINIKDGDSIAAVSTVEKNNEEEPVNNTEEDNNN